MVTYSFLWPPPSISLLISCTQTSFSWVSWMFAGYSVLTGVRVVSKKFMHKPKITFCKFYFMKKNFSVMKQRNYVQSLLESCCSLFSEPLSGISDLIFLVSLQLAYSVLPHFIRLFYNKVGSLQGSDMQFSERVAWRHCHMLLFSMYNQPSFEFYFVPRVHPSTLYPCWEGIFIIMRNATRSQFIDCFVIFIGSVTVAS